MSRKEKLKWLLSIEEQLEQEGAVLEIIGGEGTWHPVHLKPDLISDPLNWRVVVPENLDAANAEIRRLRDDLQAI